MALKYFISPSFTISHNLCYLSLTYSLSHPNAIYLPLPFTISPQCYLSLSHSLSLSNAIYLSFPFTISPQCYLSPSPIHNLSSMLFISLSFTISPPMLFIYLSFHFLHHIIDLCSIHCLYLIIFISLSHELSLPHAIYLSSIRCLAPVRNTYLINLLSRLWVSVYKPTSTDEVAL